MKKALDEERTKNTVVIDGWKIRDKSFGEFDFLIVSQPLNAIIQIEVKLSNNKSSRNNAERQFQEAFNFFEQNLSLPIEENWRYIKAVCFGEAVKEDLCGNCKTFVFSSDCKKKSVIVEISSQFKHFWEEIKWKYEPGKAVI